MGALGILGAPLQDGPSSPALVVIGVFFALAIAGLVVSSLAAVRRWWSGR